MTLTVGILASQKPQGPYTLSYLGRTNSSGSVSTLSGSYNLGAEYRDRIVFIGIARGTYALTSASSVTVGGVSATKIGGTYLVNAIEWWYVAQDTGTNGVTVQVNFPNSADACFVVYVLGGGALGGKTPTIELKTSYANNTTATSVTYPTVTNNDLFMALEVKANSGSTSSRPFTSSMSPLINDISYVGIGSDNDGFGSCHIGPVTASSGTITAIGADSSKPIEMAAIRISKAA